MLPDPDPAVWEAVCRSETNSLRAMGCLSEITDGIERFIHMEFDLPWYNFARAVGPAGDIKTALRHLVRYYQARGREARFQVPSRMAPEGLEAALQGINFRLAESPLSMYRCGCPEPAPPDPNIRIRAIGPDGVMLYTRLVIEGFGGDPGETAYARMLWAQHRRQIGLGDRLYVAEYDGQPAGTGAVGSQPASQISAISTLPPFQGRGIATQIMRVLMQEGAERGIRLFYLAAETEKAIRLYRGIGFRELTRLHNYELTGSRDWGSFP
ncbi:MAG: GNAT family N-acetyltransferase [Armatimonadetes bacterium]|nr:GNAT family N-acetyltransferase [Armatimonadota bacterium]